jgi:hypothetical protein
MISADHLRGVGGGGENLGDEGVGIESDGCEELLELVGTHGLLAGVLRLLWGVAGLGAVLRVVLGIAGLGVAGNRSLIWGWIRWLCVARIGRLVGSRIGLLSIARVLGDAGVRSLVKSDIGMRDIAGIWRLFGSRGKIELSRIVRHGSAVGCGNGMSLLGIVGVRRLIGGWSCVVLLDVVWTGCLIGNRGGSGSLIGLRDGRGRRGCRDVMAGGRLWLGGLGSLAG